MIDETREYATRDMNLSACFMSDGIKYLRVERDDADSRRLIFIFDHEGGKKLEEIERIKAQRANATHIVSSTTYDDKLRALKSIIHGC